MATIKIVLDQRRVKNDETFPVVLRIRHKDRYFDIKTNYCIQKKHFDEKKQHIISNTEANFQIEELKEKRLTSSKEEQLLRDELKKIDNLWIINGDDVKLNMSHPIAACIGDNMEDQELKKIYDVLVESNTFKNRVFLAPFKRDPIKFRQDRALVTYLALNTFYARILTLDFSNLDELMLINRNRYIERQRLLKEQNKGAKRNLTPIIIDSIKN